MCKMHGRGGEGIVSKAESKLDLSLRLTFVGP